MADKLITLPLRVPLRSARLVTRATAGVAGRVLAIPVHAIQAASSGRSGRAAPESATRPAPETGPRQLPDEPVVEALAPVEEALAPFEDVVAPAGAEQTRVEQTRVEHRPAPAEPPAAPPRLPEEAAHVSEGAAHVSEEPVLVREEAEPGAEEGAGARVTVAEPWTGYGHMKAQDVIDRVRTASVAELAAMRLYEARHRARRTVLAAVDRQLKLAGGNRPA